MTDNLPKGAVFEELIAEGKIISKPATYYHEATILNIDLDALQGYIFAALSDSFLNWTPIRVHYIGTESSRTKELKADLLAMSDIAVASLYNRLRTVAERYHPATRLAALNTRPPIPNKLELPRFLSSILGSVGMLRVPDNYRDTLLIYSPNPSNVNNYGRTDRPNFDLSAYDRLVYAMQQVQLPLAPVDLTNLQGSFWTTIVPKQDEDGNVDMFATFHHSHYTNDDVIKACLIPPLESKSKSAFEYMHMTLDFINKESAVRALEEVGAPSDSSAFKGITHRPVSALFNVDVSGLTKPIAAIGENPGVDKGFYVLGRGSKALFTRKLAAGLTSTEIDLLLKEQFRHK